MVFWRGFVTAILMLEWLALAWLVRVAPATKAMFADIKPGDLPWTFAVVTSTEYAIGSLVGLLAVAALATWLPRRPRGRLLGLVLVAIAAAVLIAATWWGLYSPIHELAGRIR